MIIIYYLRFLLKYNLYNKIIMATSTKVDLLEEDKAIAGQKFVCISFVSPENHIKNRNLFYFENFVKTWDMTKSIDKFQSFLNFISYKYNLNNENINNDLKEFLKEEKNELLNFTVNDDFKTFLDNKQDDLDKEYNTSNKFQTNVRGIKVRGVYSTQEEAEMRCKTLRENDPNHDVYVGPVGLWMPWEPEAYKTGRVEYLEKELNDLMHEKKKNDTAAKDEFEQRIKETKEKAIEDNIKKAEESGNVLTQILDDEGNLVNINQVDYDTIPDDSVIMPNSKDGKPEQLPTSADVTKQLFDSNNIQIVNVTNDKKED